MQLHTSWAEGLGVLNLRMSLYNGSNVGLFVRVLFAGARLMKRREGYIPLPNGVDHKLLRTYTVEDHSAACVCASERWSLRKSLFRN